MSEKHLHFLFSHPVNTHERHAKNIPLLQTIVDIHVDDKQPGFDGAQVSHFHSGYPLTSLRREGENFDAEFESHDANAIRKMLGILQNELTYDQFVHVAIRLVEALFPQACSWAEVSNTLSEILNINERSVGRVFSGNIRHQ